MKSGLSSGHDDGMQMLVSLTDTFSPAKCSMLRFSF